MFIICVLCHLALCLCNTCANAATFSATDVCEKIEKRAGQIIDLQFKYTVATNLIDSMVQGTQSEEDLTMRIRQESFSILRSNSDTHSLPWISWFVYYEKKGRTPIASFFVYDGKNHYRFLRGDPQIPQVVPVNFGLIDAGYNNAFLVENYFERILFLKINGSSLNLDSIKKSTSSTEYRYVKQTTYLGKKALVYERVRVPGKITNVVTVLKEPCYMVVSYKTVSIPEHTVLAELKIEELASFENIIYPCRGSYKESQSKRGYTFRVTSVERLSQLARTDWLPDWPGGTDVRDVVNNNAFTVERSPEEAERVEKRARE